MTTILPKEPVVTDRKNVILSDAERRNLRRKLKGSVEVAQDVLNPRNQLRRLVERNTAKAKDVAGDAAQVAKKNAPVLGAIGLGALVFAARRPISSWISKLRKSKAPNAPDGD
jgi:hypothetical protein